MDYVIIVAGGKGLRMGGEVPKQFLPIGGLPVLMRTMERFREYSASLQIVLVLPKAQQTYWLELCEKYRFPKPSLEISGTYLREKWHLSLTKGYAPIFLQTVARHVSTPFRMASPSSPTMSRAWWAFTTACDRLSL